MQIKAKEEADEEKQELCDIAVRKMVFTKNLTW